MARQQLGTAPANPPDAVTKAYVDARAPGDGLTTNSGATANQWTRIATATVAAQYSEASGVITVVSNGDGDTVSAVAAVRWRIKQQAAFGSSPIIETAMLSGMGNITAINFATVVTSMSGPTTADLYLQVVSTYRQFDTLVDGEQGALTLLSNQSLLTSLPTGVVATQYGFWQMSPTAFTPTQTTDLTTKAYVDARTPRVTAGTTAPTSPAVNDIWIDTN